MGKMEKRPTISDVMNYYKYAKTVICLSTSKKENISKNITEEINEWDNKFWIRTETSSKGEGSVLLWSESKGYAKILTYKNNDMKYEISKEQILEVAEWGNSVDKLKIRGWFPDAFETELIVGKWYKSKIEGNKFKCVFNSLDSKGGQLFDGYGFDCFGNFFNDEQDMVSKEKSKKLVPMSESEVFEALKNEAVKRGFVDGTYFLDIEYNAQQKCHDVLKICESTPKDVFGLQFGIHNGLIFKDGIWATIIETISREEAEKLLNKKIV